MPTFLKHDTPFQSYAATIEDSRSKIILELVLKTLPAIIFLILASIRFCEIRPIGFSKTTVYSKMYTGKVTC